MGLPVEVAQRESGDQARCKQLVDIVGIEVLDWRETVNWSGKGWGREKGTMEYLPVTLEDENGCSMLNSAGSMA